MVKVILHGCNGRMGTMISELVEKDANVQIVAGVDAYGQSKFSYPVYENIALCDVSAAVIREFS